MVERELERREVPGYIEQKHGKPARVSERYLAKLAVTGGGPRFTKYGRKVGYAPSDIDEWISRRARRLLSTSQAA